MSEVVGSDRPTVEVCDRHGGGREMETLDGGLRPTGMKWDGGWGMVIGGR